ncbi:hypothetical protein Tco_0685917 [Tanacetum coccineum]
MAMTIQSGVRGKIMAAQSEAFKQENVLAERLHGLDQNMERKEDESLYFMDSIWVPLVGCVRTMIMDKAHKTRYYVHPGADKMYHDLRDKLKAAKDHQKSYADNRHKPLEFEVRDQVLLRASSWKGVMRFGKKGKLARVVLADANLHVPLDEIKIDKTLQLSKEPVEIMTVR